MLVLSLATADLNECTYGVGVNAVSVYYSFFFIFRLFICLFMFNKNNNKSVEFNDYTSLIKSNFLFSLTSS